MINYFQQCFWIYILYNGIKKINLNTEKKYGTKKKNL